VRSQVLLGSVRVRDALLTADRQALDQDREQVETTYRIILMALADYEPLIGSTTAGKALTKLRAEVEQFHDSSMTVLVMAHGRSPAAIRDVLNQHIAPGRAGCRRRTDRPRHRRAAGLVASARPPSVDT